MIKFSAASLALALTISPLRAETSPECPRPDQTRVTVQVSPSVVTVGEPKPDLSQLAAGSYTPFANAEHLALTTTNLSQDWEASYEVVSHDGGYCLSPDAIQVQLGFPEVTVHLRSDVAVDECRRAVALEHEQHHIEEDRNLLLEHRDDISSRVEAAVAEHFPIFSRSQQVAQTLASLRIKQILAEAMEAFLADRVALHRQIDAPDHLLALADACSIPCAR